MADLFRSDLVARLRKHHDNPYGPPGIKATALEAADEIQRQQTVIESIWNEAMAWTHGEDCSGYAGQDGEDPDEPKWECDCGLGAILRFIKPGLEVYVDHDEGTTVLEKGSGG